MGVLAVSLRYCFLNVESLDQFADFKIVCKSIFASNADLQLWEVKRPELIPASDVNFIHLEILSFDAFLCGFTVVIDKAR